MSSKIAALKRPPKFFGSTRDTFSGWGAGFGTAFGGGVEQAVKTSETASTIVAALFFKSTKSLSSDRKSLRSDLLPHNGV
jgi:hypothetical protein